MDPLRSAAGCARAFFAEAVENGTERIEYKTMMFHKVCADAFEFLTVKVDENPAFFTLAVETGLFRAVGSFSDVFETGRCVGIDDVFIDQAFVDHAVKLPVDGRHADRAALRAEIGTDITDRKMLPGDGSKVGKKRFTLLCFVLRPGTHKYVSLLHAI